MTSRIVTHGDLRARDDRSATMSRTPIPVQGGRPQFVDAGTGQTLSEKPEELTHLHGNLLVAKTHPRIVFRGKLDTLMAEVLTAQVLARQEQNNALFDHLGEVLDFTRSILGAEVKDAPLPEIHMEGMDTAGIRYASHHVRESCGIEHPIPTADMGALAVSLNHLRTEIRETELAAAQAFTNANGECERKDIVEGLNRLSSYVYLLFCREVARQRGVNAETRDAVTTGGNMTGYNSARPSFGNATTETQGAPIPVEVSARHVHLSKEVLCMLFGGNYELTPVRELSQPGQYLSKEKIKVLGPKGSFPKVSILGPLRNEVQVEISLSDARLLGVQAPINLSGDLTGAADVTLVGPMGKVEVKGSAIVAKEHLHMPSKLAESYGVHDGERVRIRMASSRGATLDDVIVRVSDDAGLAVHIDTDQANAAGIGNTVEGRILR